MKVKPDSRGLEPGIHRSARGFVILILSLSKDEAAQPSYLMVRQAHHEGLLTAC